MKRRHITGAILISALAIAGVLLLWAVAATYRANFQSNAALFSYQKSEVYYLAKRAASRAIYLMNNQPDWIASHTGRGNADTTTPDTLCWVEEISTDQFIMRCEAKVGNHTTQLTIPMLTQDDETTQLFSVAPSQNGGPDVIGRSSTSAGDWSGLPPIPGHDRILSIAPTPNGDCYAIGGTGTQTTLWRYRPGRGWMQMPDVPGGVELSGLSAGGDDRLVCLGSDNSLLILTLGSSASTEMQWTAVPAPSGATLTSLTADRSGAPTTYAAAESSGAARLYLHDETNGWATLYDPPSYAYDPMTGGPLPTGSTTPPNYDGGITADDQGHLFVATNPPGSASVIQQFTPDSPGATTGTWNLLPPVRAMEWTGPASTSNPSGYITNMSNLEMDPQGQLWAQWNKTADEYYVVNIDPSP